MAIARDRKKLLYKIAKSYYEDGLTQGQIGKRFGISRIKVSRLLQQARAEKLVQITVASQESSNADLERELEAQYGLDEAVIVSASSNDKSATTRELGPAAVECLLRCLQGNEVLSVSWGSTLLSVVDSLPIKPWPEMTVVQMMGGLGRPEAEVHGNDIARRMAQAFEARPRMLSAPGIVASKLVRDALLADPQISVLRDNTETVGTNNDWGEDPNAERTSEVAAFFNITLEAQDAAMVRTLGAGLYTVVVTGADGGTGITRVGAADVSDVPSDTEPPPVAGSCDGLITDAFYTSIAGQLDDGITRVETDQIIGCEGVDDVDPALGEEIRTYTDTINSTAIWVYFFGDVSFDSEFIDSSASE